MFKELQERNAELREALEHQTATAEVLGIISRSPTDVQPVLDAIVESAARVCGIDDVVLRLQRETIMVPRAHFGPIPISRVEISTMNHSFAGCASMARFTFPTSARRTISQWWVPRWLAHLLVVPLRQQGEFIGALNARRTEVRPFTPAQIKLLETFADQAVIAIENVRLFQELKESLEQQTATSEILGVIASSPTDIQPVLDTVAENARATVRRDRCAIRLAEGDELRLVALAMDPFRCLKGRSSTYRYAVRFRAAPSWTGKQFTSMILQQRLRTISRRRSPDSVGVRTYLPRRCCARAVAIGAIMIRRTEVRPFTRASRLSFLKTFADQAVIAIENVRLFKELQERNRDLTEALEQQTATSEILRVISQLAN